MALSFMRMRAHHLRLLSGLCLALTLFWLMPPNNHYYALNTPLFLWVNQAALGPEWVWHNITFLGDKLLVFAVLIFWQRKHTAILWDVFLMAVVLGSGLHGLKHLFALLRPASVLGAEQVHLMGDTLLNYALPSGHAMTAFALAAYLMRFLPLYGRCIALLLAGLIAYSRMVVGAHWPMDVVAGAVLGWWGAKALLPLLAYWPWGATHPYGRRLMQGLWLAVCLYLFVYNSGYTLSLPLARAVAVLCIGYWLFGLWQQHNKQKNVGL